MKSGKKFRSDQRRRARSDAPYLVALLACLLVSGCAPTVTPVQVVDKGASYDGAQRNSGFLGFDAAGLGYLTAHARDRYNADTGLKDAGIRPGVIDTVLLDKGKPVGFVPTNSFSIDPEHLVDWTRVLRARKTARGTTTQEMPARRATE